MVPDKNVLKSDLWEGKCTKNSSIYMICSSEIPPIDISIFIQWEGSSL